MSGLFLDIALLKRRAAALARPLSDRTLGTGGQELLVTLVGQARYAARLEALMTVVPLPRLTRLPQAPYFVAGLAPLHGRIVTIVDLGALMGEVALPPLRFALILELNGEPFGLGVPTLVGLDLDRSTPGAAIPAGVPEPARQLIEAVSPDGVCRLNLPRLVETLTSAESRSTAQ